MRVYDGRVGGYQPGGDCSWAVKQHGHATLLSQEYLAKHSERFLRNNKWALSLSAIELKGKILLLNP